MSQPPYKLLNDGYAGPPAPPSYGTIAADQVVITTPPTMSQTMININPQSQPIIIQGGCPACRVSTVWKLLSLTMH